MSVRNIKRKARRSPDTVALTLEIDAESWGWVEAWAKKHAYPSTADCMAAHINRMLLELAPPHPGWSKEAVGCFLDGEAE